MPLVACVMRVVAGEFRGRKLTAPTSGSTRPTTDRCARRSSTPSTASTSSTALSLADLYAGSGALGIEALSRGAQHCTFVESDRLALSAIHDNIASLGLSGRSRVMSGDVVAMVSRIDCDIAFADPPYEFDDWERVLDRPRRRTARRRGSGPLVDRPLGAAAGQALRPHLGHVPRRGRDGLTSTTVAPTMAIVLYPGSFDPIHLGHLDIIEQSAELFGDVVVAVMHNDEKPAGVFTVDDRVRADQDSASELDLTENVRVVTHTGLAVDAARLAGADFIVKGLRNAGDFEIEQQMALTNHSVSGVRTVYLPCRMDRGFISSRFVREIARYGGAVQHLVPRPVAGRADDQVPTCGRRPSTT